MTEYQWPAIGSRVVIVDKKHPWHGSAGVLSKVEVITSGGTELACVELDSPRGHKAGVFDPKSLRVLLSGERP